MGVVTKLSSDKQRKKPSPLATMHHYSITGETITTHMPIYVSRITGPEIPNQLLYGTSAKPVQFLL
jgi:hypothetical protein